MKLMCFPYYLPLLDYINDPERKFAKFNRSKLIGTDQSGNETQYAVIRDVRDLEKFAGRIYEEIDMERIEERFHGPLRVMCGPRQSVQPCATL